MTQRIAVIVNQASGSGHPSEWAENLAGSFRAHGCDASVTMVKDGSEIENAVRRAVADGFPTIVAGGGDGTVNAVASKVVGTDIRLGVLPLGTLNHFAKDLRIPLQLDEAVQNIAAGHCSRIDAGEVNGRIFLNNSSIGLYPELVTLREADQRRYGVGKWRAFVRASLEVLRRYPYLHTRLIVDGQPQDRHTPCVFIGNNEYGTSGFGIGGRKRLDAGILSVYVVGSPRRSALFALAVRALCGSLQRTPDFEAMLATELIIDTRQTDKRVATDGEVTAMQAPLRYRILPGALAVIVPDQSENDDAAKRG